MVEDRIGYRYAKSVFELAKEKGILEEVREDMIMIDSACDERDFLLFLKSPLINARKKQKVVDAVFKGQYSSELTPHLVEIVIRKHREQYLHYVATSFLELYDREKHITRGELVSAAPLSDAQLTEIKKIIEEKTGDSFDFVQTIDPELIGGFILKVGGQLFDGSIASSLQQLSQEFSQNTYIRKY